MTQAEFKAWFEGFSENISGSPSKKQWERICARVAEIDGMPITVPFYIDRWGPYFEPRWSYTTTCGSTTTIGQGQTVSDTMLWNAGRAESLQLSARGVQ